MSQVQRVRRGRAAVEIVLGVLVAGGCATVSVPPRCGPGAALSDGACVPTPSLVFSRCVDTFRKTRIERQAGQQTRVSANVDRYGGAAVEHGKKDDRAEEYAGLPVELLPQAIAECRRQEEEEREDRIAEAWAAADRERARAREADARAAVAAREKARAEAEGEALAQELRRLQDRLEGAETEAADEQALSLSLPPPPSLTQTDDDAVDSAPAEPPETDAQPD